MYIITITIMVANLSPPGEKAEKVRVQMDDKKSAQDFMWWCRQQGHSVRMKNGKTVNLSQKEIAIGSRLVNAFSKEKK